MHYVLDSTEWNIFLRKVEPQLRIPKQVNEGMQFLWQETLIIMCLPLDSETLGLNCLQGQPLIQMKDEFPCGFGSIWLQSFPELQSKSQGPIQLLDPLCAVFGLSRDSKLGFPLLGSYFEYDLFLFLQTSTERELWTFANLNLAIVYVRTRRETDFMALLDRISPERLPSQSHSLQAAAYYIQGLQEFFAAKYNDAK